MPPINYSRKVTRSWRSIFVEHIFPDIIKKNCLKTIERSKKPKQSFRTGSSSFQLKALCSAKQLYSIEPPNHRPNWLHRYQIYSSSPNDTPTTITNYPKRIQYMKTRSYTFTKMFKPVSTTISPTSNQT